MVKPLQHLRWLLFFMLAAEAARLQRGMQAVVLPFIRPAVSFVPLSTTGLHSLITACHHTNLFDGDHQILKGLVMKYQY
jgi:hypothetical protein